MRSRCLNLPEYPADISPPPLRSFLNLNTRVLHISMRHQHSFWIPRCADKCSSPPSSSSLSAPPSFNTCTLTFQPQYGLSHTSMPDLSMYASLYIVDHDIQFLQAKQYAQNHKMVATCTSFQHDNTEKDVGEGGPNVRTKRCGLATGKKRAWPGFEPGACHNQRYRRYLGIGPLLLLGCGRGRMNRTSLRSDNHTTRPPGRSNFSSALRMFDEALSEK